MGDAGYDEAAHHHEEDTPKQVKGQGGGTGGRVGSGL